MLTNGESFWVGLVVGVIVAVLLVGMAIGFSSQDILCSGIGYSYEVPTAIVNDICYVQIEDNLVPASTLINIGR